MEKYNEGHIYILHHLIELAQESAPVVISLGYVDDQKFCHNGIVVKNAPSSVVKAIVNSTGVSTTHLEPDGLHIEPRREERVVDDRLVLRTYKTIDDIIRSSSAYVKA